jgi:Recombination endonuclease VII
MKRCPDCTELLPQSAFGRNKTQPDGLSFYCLTCNRARSNEWYRRRRRSLGKEVRDLSWVPDGFRWCPTCEQAVAHEDYVRNVALPSGFGTRCKACNNRLGKEAYWRRRYGMTKAEVDQLRARQGNVCAICDSPDPEHLDHDHSSGKIRALLCQRCNHGLGLFRDEPYLLQVAALYVEGHRQQQAYETLLDATGTAAEGASRPGEPPVGSHRRPGARSTSTRSTGRNSGARRRTQAGEADG